MKKTKHSKHKIRFHLIIIPKYRRDILKGVYKTMLEDLLVYRVTELGGDVLEFAVQPDHVHLFFEISPDIQLSGFVARLKQFISSQMMRSFQELKAKSFFARGYFIGSCGVDSDMLTQYIRKQS